MPNVEGGQTKVYVAAFVLSRSRYKYAQEQSRPFTSVDLVRICHDCFRYMGRMPADVFQEEREYLRPLPVCDQAKRPVICRTVRKDNTIIYDSNRYSVPPGTHTTQPEVRIETPDGTLYIQTLFGEPICEHRISSGRGLLIQSMSHRRDRTSKLDKLLEELDAELGGRATELLTAIPVDDPKYHVNTQKRPLSAYAKVGDPRC